MDINQIMPLLSNLLHKGNTNQAQNNNNENFSNIYPETTFDGKTITNQNQQTQTNNTNNSILSSLIPSLLGGGNFDISNILSLFNKSGDNSISTLFTPKNNKKTNPPKICEFVKVDEYDFD